MRGCLRFVFIIPFVLLVISQSSYSQSNVTKPQSNAAQTRSSASNEDTGRVGAAVKVSTLGGGAEVAVRVTHRTNVRAGFNVITYSRGFNKDGIAYISLSMNSSRLSTASTASALSCFNRSSTTVRPTAPWMRPGRN